MQKIEQEGKYVGNLMKIDIFGDAPKYRVVLTFITEEGECEGHFHVSLKAGGENTTATAQLKNAGFPDAVFYDGTEMNVNAFWDAFEAFEKTIGSTGHKLTVKADEYNGETSLRVAFIDGPHRGKSSGGQRARRPTEPAPF